MNKVAIKRFAIEARNKLRKKNMYGIWKRLWNMAGR